MLNPEFAETLPASMRKAAKKKQPKRPYEGVVRGFREGVKATVIDGIVHIGGEIPVRLDSHNNWRLA